MFRTIQLTKNPLFSTAQRCLSRSAATNQKVGFIGLGNMGSEMVAHLQKAGHEMYLFDSNPETLKKFEKLGCKSMGSAAEVAAASEKVISMVPLPQHVLDVYLGPKGAIAGAKKGTILMDSSTVDPITSRTVHAEAAKAGIEFCDAPVSGAVPAARAATLTFMVGGKAETVEQIREILLCMGKNVIRTGEIGTGVTAKICNNMMLGISMVGASEVLNLGQRLGIEPKLLTQILNVSSGRTWVSEIYHPVPGCGDPKLPPNHGYEGGFMTKLIAKDLMLAQSVASASMSPIPMGALANQIYRMLLNNGHGDKDFTYTYPFLKEDKPQ